MNTYIVIVNYNGSTDLIECLESVYRLSEPNVEVIVCDNGSTDASVDNIKKWAQGELMATPESDDDTISKCVSPPIPKPIQFVQYDCGDTEQVTKLNRDSAAKMTLITLSPNIGYPGAANVGMKYALARGDFEYLWLLNPDTVVDRSALTNLLNEARSNPLIGMCGSTVVHYYDPAIIQIAGGGTYNKWLGSIRGLKRGAPLHESIDKHQMLKAMDFTYGASMLVSKRFLEQIGLMRKEYFMYFEELEWICRARGQLVLGYAPDSIVYHKEGRTIGTNAGKKRSLTADYFSVRNRLRFTFEYYPYALVTLYLALCAAVVRRLFRRQPDRAAMIVKMLLGGPREWRRLPQRP